LFARFIYLIIELIKDQAAAQSGVAFFSSRTAARAGRSGASTPSQGVAGVGGCEVGAAFVVSSTR